MSRGRYLTLDLGNSALKLVSWDDSGSVARAAERLRIENGPALAAELAAWLAARPRAAGAALSTVAGAAAGSAVRDALARAIEGELLAPPDWGGRNACGVPESVGTDRLCAARGAWEAVGGSAVVVDAGTALTVDALGRDPDGGGPVFLGGAIAPGPALLADALARGGARLFEVEPMPDAPALGRDTASALRAGVSVGFAGAARHLVERVAAEAELSDAPVVLTGGALRFLEAPATFPGRGLLVRADLVHEGLFAAARSLV